MSTSRSVDEQHYIASAATIHRKLANQKRKNDADVHFSCFCSVKAPILAGHPPEVSSLRKNQKISQSVKEENDHVGDPKLMQL